MSVVVLLTIFFFVLSRSKKQQLEIQVGTTYTASLSTNMIYSNLSAQQIKSNKQNKSQELPNGRILSCTKPSNSINHKN